MHKTQQSISLKSEISIPANRFFFFKPLEDTEAGEGGIFKARSFRIFPYNIQKRIFFS